MTTERDKKHRRNRRKDKRYYRSTQKKFEKMKEENKNKPIPVGYACLSNLGNFFGTKNEDYERKMQEYKKTSGPERFEQAMKEADEKYEKKRIEETDVKRRSARFARSLTGPIRNYMSRISATGG